MEKQTECFDVVVSNPPYNAFVGSSATPSDGHASTIHAGNFGDEFTRHILEGLPELVTDNGYAFVVATWLMKDGCLAYPRIQELTTHGTLILFHTPIVGAVTWEGLKELFSAENIGRFPPGYLRQMIVEADYFDQVTWGVLCWLRGHGVGGFHLIENIQMDRQLLTKSAIAAAQVLH